MSQREGQLKYSIRSRGILNGKSKPPTQGPLWDKNSSNRSKDSIEWKQDKRSSLFEHGPETEPWSQHSATAIGFFLDGAELKSIP